MQKIEKIIKEVKYVAADGREFRSEKDCLLYEKYGNQDIKELLKGYVVFGVCQNIEYALYIKKVEGDLAIYLKDSSLSFAVHEHHKPVLYVFRYDWEYLGDLQTLQRKKEVSEKNLSMYYNLIEANIK